MGWPEILRALGVVIAVFFFAAAFTPLPAVLARWTATPPRLEPADAIVVLGHRIEPNGALSDRSLRRAIHGIVLHRRGLAPLIVFSGTAGEAEVRATLARDLGIPPAAVATGTGGRTTREEAIQVGRILQARGARRILLVTDPQHMARAERVFAGVGVEVRPAPVDETARHLDQMREILEALVARLYHGAVTHL